MKPTLLGRIELLVPENQIGIKQLKNSADFFYVALVKAGGFDWESLGKVI